MLLKEYLPNFMSETKEFTELFKVEQTQINELFKQIEDALTDTVVLGSSKLATARYENIVGIIPKLSDNLKKRQLDVLAVYNEVPPFTFERLNEILTALLGKDSFKLNIDIPNYLLKVVLRRDKLEFLNQVNDMLERIVPVNLIIDYKVEWNTWGDLKVFTWGKLSSATWKEARESEEFNSDKEVN